LLGLLVAPSVAGGLLGAGALVAFVARTPVKIVSIDLFRRRRLRRTVVAMRVASAELAVLCALVAGAALLGKRGWWWPLLAALPLVATEMWFDMKSRSRRTVPELCGAVGIASVAAATARAGGASWPIAAGLSVVLAARSFASIPFTRSQVRRGKGHSPDWKWIAASMAASLALTASGWGAGWVPLASLIAVAALVALDLWWLRLPPPRVAVLGAVQVLLGLAVVLTTAGAIRWH
jgi:hypothetical protein